MRGGRKSRDKGNRVERWLINYLRDWGWRCERVPLSGSAGGRFTGDFLLPMLGEDLVGEVKCRATGFRELYAWLEGRDVLVVKADRREPLVILPLSLAAKIGWAAESAPRKAS